MKKVLSVSIGSATRDHTTEAVFLGEPFWLSRQGTNGDIDKALQLYRQHDGQVDAFGVGGTDFYLVVNGHRYYFRIGRRIRQAIKLSKVADGNGLKHLLGAYAIQALQEHGLDLRGRRALKTCAVDLYGMAQALVKAGCDVTFGDVMFGLGLPVPVHSLRTIHMLAAVLCPVITRVPYTWLYPLGEAQDKEPSQKYKRVFDEAEIIAGDFMQIWTHLPPDLSGKIMVTNTTTARNVEELQKRHLHILVTTTPRLEGRSFGTNVMEAVCRCLVDKPDDQIVEQDFVDLIERIPLKPQVHVLN